ncbi:hypothetical protein ACJX0J_008752, partial [Zea mays]
TMAIAALASGTPWEPESSAAQALDSNPICVIFIDPSLYGTTYFRFLLMWTETVSWFSDQPVLAVSALILNLKIEVSETFC